MNDPLLTLLASPRRIDLFGLDDRGLFAHLARASFRLEAHAILATLPARHRRPTLVADGELSPPSLLHGLASDLDSLVLVPDSRLANIPHHQPRLRARHAAPATPLASLRFISTSPHTPSPSSATTISRCDLRQVSRQAGPGRKNAGALPRPVTVSVRPALHRRRYKSGFETIPTCSATGLLGITGPNLRRNRHRGVTSPPGLRGSPGSSGGG